MFKNNTNRFIGSAFALAALTLSALSAAPAHAQTATLTLTPSLTTASVGSFVTLDLVGTNFATAVAWETKIRLNTTYLAFDPAFSGSTPFQRLEGFFNDQLINTLQDSSGTLALGFGNSSLTPYVGNAPVSLGRFRVQVVRSLATAPGQSSALVLGTIGTDSLVLDGNANELLRTVSGASIAAPVVVPEANTVLLLSLASIVGTVTVRRRGLPA